MAFRIVKINSRCKLETRLNYLVCMKDQETKILLDEISTLIIESQQACITSALISELVEHGIKVVFCDRKHNPQSELVPYFGSNDSYRKVKKQCQWSSSTKDRIWKRIIQMKIHNQAMVLKRENKEDGYQTLLSYEKQVADGDVENREGLAAKTYFASLYGSSFDRRRECFPQNSYLDYGYAILLSAVNREIASLGYLTQIGIHHIGETNPFNLGCDLMEPFRPLLDGFLVSKNFEDDNFKSFVLSCFGFEIFCGKRNMVFDNAIRSFVISCIHALNEDNPDLIETVRAKDEQL